MAKEAVESTIETGISSRLQPWQAIFAVMTYALSQFGIEDEKALILYGLILATLGFVQISTYKHKVTGPTRREGTTCRGPRVDKG